MQAVQEMGAGVEEIDLEMAGDDEAPPFDPETHALIEHGLKPNPRKKKKVVKKWRDEWAETYKWAYVSVHEGTHRIYCSVCKEYGRKHRRNPYGNEGSRNMQMSALEEHNNSLLHKEALRLQMASKDKGLGLIDRPLYIKGEVRKFFFHSMYNRSHISCLCWKSAKDPLRSNLASLEDGYETQVYQLRPQKP